MLDKQAWAPKSDDIIMVQRTESSRASIREEKDLIHWQGRDVILLELQGSCVFLKGTSACIRRYPYDESVNKSMTRLQCANLMEHFLIWIWLQLLLPVWCRMIFMVCCAHAVLLRLR